MKKIVVASNNKGKIREFKQILADYEVLSMADCGVQVDVEETGATFEENALIKAGAGLKNTGLIPVADESGICVDYLDGAPGVFSARYCGRHGDDAANNKKLLN